MIYCKEEELSNESDVEQKLIVPLILGQDQAGLGFSTGEFQSKKTIKKLSIDKGESKKSYRPDFIVFLDGIPVIVIEAKHPNENLDEGYREARLYAGELNAKFSTGINPCTKILASNGKEIWYGNFDTNTLEGKLKFSDIAVSNSEFDKFIEFCCKDKLAKELDVIIKKVRGGNQFHKPTAILGGRAMREEEVTGNVLGLTMMQEYQRIFNPQTSEDRIDIVKNAYISSTAVEKHTDPIRKIILATLPPSVSGATKIQDTSKPKELLNKIFGKKRLTNQLILLVGNVGSGKTTFIDYLKEVALASEDKAKTSWVYIDLNNAPHSRTEIYPWVQDKIVTQLREINSDLNLDHIDELKKLYSQDIKAFDDGEGSLLKNDPKEYNKVLASLIQNLKNDSSKTTKAYTRYLCGERGKTFVLVLDNCDKRDKETQLLMFEVAKWAKEEYQAVVFLPLRDVTFDLHKTEPPLDTVIKDMTFRIDPPKLSEVLYRRVAYAMTASAGEITYTTSNNLHFKVTKKQQENYLACVLDSLYNGTPLAKKLIDGLSGRDIRRGIEIFIAFCKSGHITPERMIKMRVSNGDYKVESHVVMKALLRGDRRFYSDRYSYIKNLFHSYPEDKKPDPFVRIAILDWFEKRKGNKGPSNVRGFHKVSDLVNDLQLAGHSEKRIFAEVVFLLRERCLISESQIEETLTELSEEDIAEEVKDNDLIKIASAGAIHLELLLNLTYLAACSEDVWYENQKTAQDIAGRITNRIGAGHFSLHTALHNSLDLVNYLTSYRETYYPDNDVLIDNDLPFLDLETIRQAVIEQKESMERRNSELQTQYPKGTKHNGHVIAHKKVGVLVSLAPGVSGLVRNESITTKEQYNPGMSVSVKIVDFDEMRGKFNFTLESN